MNMERLAASYRLEYEVKAKDYVRGGEVSSALRAVLKQLSLHQNWLGAAVWLAMRQR